MPNRSAVRLLDGESADITEQWGALHFDLHLEPLYEDDRIVGVGGIAVDASKRRIVEQALVESEARFRTLVERLPICTYVNPLGLPIRTTYMSPYVEKLLGFPVERWLTEPDFFVTRLHPDDVRVDDPDRIDDARNFRGEDVARPSGLPLSDPGPIRNNLS